LKQPRNNSATTTTTKRKKIPNIQKIKDGNKKKLCEMEGAKPRNIFYFIVYFCWPKGEKLKRGRNLNEQKFRKINAKL